MKLTGQKLKEKREAARLTISEVSLATKINPKVLAAMEVGDMEHLPAKTFLRGFIRSYANFLKMNPDELLAVFNQELGEAAAQKEAAAPAPQESAAASPKVDVNGEGSGAFRMIIVGGILVLIVLIIGVRSLIQKYEREGKVETSTDLTAAKVVPLDVKKADEKSDDEAPTLTPPPADGTNAAAPAPAGSASDKAGTAALPEPKAEAKSSKAAETPVAVKAAEPMNTEKKPAETKPVVKSEPAAAAAAAAVNEPKPASSGTATIPPEKPADKTAEKKKSKSHHEIILEALDNVQVSFQLHGQKKTVSLAPSQVHTIVADEPITLNVSDGGALNITDNGHDKGPAGDLGHPKQVNIP